MAEMTTVLLSGSLVRRFGREHKFRLESGTAAEAFNALRATLPGFEQHMVQSGQRYAIYRNRENVPEDAFTLGGTREIRIVPIIEGRKGGVFAVLGVALFAVGMFMTGGMLGMALMAVGAGMAVGGVMQMLAPQPNGLDRRESPENSPSYAFGGAVNTTAAGHPVPLLYGKRRIGGAVISAGIYAEDLA